MHAGVVGTVFRVVFYDPLYLQGVFWAVYETYLWILWQKPLHITLWSIIQLWACPKSLVPFCSWEAPWLLATVAFSPGDWCVKIHLWFGQIWSKGVLPDLFPTIPQQSWYLKALILLRHAQTYTFRSSCVGTPNSHDVSTSMQSCSWLNNRKDLLNTYVSISKYVCWGV